MVSKVNIHTAGGEYKGHFKTNLLPLQLKQIFYKRTLIMTRSKELSLQHVHNLKKRSQIFAYDS